MATPKKESLDARLIRLKKAVQAKAAKASGKKR